MLNVRKNVNNLAVRPDLGLLVQLIYDLKWPSLEQIATELIFWQNI